MQELAFFDQLQSLYADSADQELIKQYLNSSTLLDAPLSFKNLALKFFVRLLPVIGVVSNEYSQTRELKPLFQIIAELDPHYYVIEKLKREMLRNYCLTPEQQNQLMKGLLSLLEFWQRRHESLLNPIFASAIPLDEWQALFPNKNNWQALLLMSDLGLTKPSSRQGFQAWKRYFKGENLSADEDPQIWQQLCAKWVKANPKSSAPYIDLLAGIFASSLPFLRLSQFCGPVPACDVCPLAKDCRWKQSVAEVKTQETLLKEQFSNFSNEELLSELLSIAADQSENFQTQILPKGQLRELDQISLFSLSQISQSHPEIGLKIKILVELCKRYNSEELIPGKRFDNARDIYQHFRSRLQDLKQEVFLIVLLDTKHQYLKDITITKGLLNKSLVHPREVFQPAIELRSSAIICLHNHPSGDPQASKEDIDITQRLVQVGKLVGISVIDHVIIGSNNFYSFAENGNI